MSKKDANIGRPIHRIDLSLPIVQTDSYEIFYPIPSSQNFRTISRQKPFIDNNKKSINQTTRIRSSPRLKHLIGPVSVNLVVDMTTITTELNSTIGDTISNPLINSSSSNRTLKSLPIINKRNKQKNLKDDSDRSQSSSSNRLLYESFGSFDEHNINKTKTNNMWLNIHHPQLSSAKSLHIRKTFKHSLNSNNMQSNILFDNFEKELIPSPNEQLYEKIEQLTKNYFPTIQQIRHSRPSPELIHNRMYLHREQKRHFMPTSSRTRVV